MVARQQKSRRVVVRDMKIAPFRRKCHEMLVLKLKAPAGCFVGKGETARIRIGAVSIELTQSNHSTPKALGMVIASGTSYSL